MSTTASLITNLTIVYSTVYSDADQTKHQSTASLAFVWGIHRGPVNSPHKWPVTRNMFPFDDVIMVLIVSALLVPWIYYDLLAYSALRTQQRFYHNNPRRYVNVPPSVLDISTVGNNVVAIITTVLL